MKPNNLLNLISEVSVPGAGNNPDTEFFNTVFYADGTRNIGRSVPTFIKLSLSNSPVEGLPTLIIDTVAHELKHAYDYDQGKLKGLIGNLDAPYPNPSEVSAVNFENRVRVRIRLPLRRKYVVSIPSDKLEDPWRYKTDKK